MSWLMIIVSLIVLWVASLCKILLASRSPTKATFLSNAGGVLCKRNVMLVIAHPDDESMFFTLTINYRTEIGHNIHILCMSTGNANGNGSIRKEELYQASVILKDGFGKEWDCELLARIVGDEIHPHATDV